MKVIPVLSLKKLVPVRLLRNHFFKAVWLLKQNNAAQQKKNCLQLLGRGRAKKGMFEGNLEEGELEIGQVSAIVNDIQPAAKIIEPKPGRNLKKARRNPLRMV